MATITIEIDEPVFRGLEETAREQNRTASELLRDLAVAYEQSHRAPRKKGRSIRDIPRLSLGGMLNPVGTIDEIFEEMVDLRNE
ncbi:MAG: hypothetical protein SH850_17735 [Planctomycetaceae bacterium]|nr:hypothetical protein [Planctomycetaceae bacterium]